MDEKYSVWKLDDKLWSFQEGFDDLEEAAKYFKSKKRKRTIMLVKKLGVIRGQSVTEDQLLAKARCIERHNYDD